MKVRFPGPAVPPDIGREGTLHPTLGNLKPGENEVPAGAEREARAAAAVGLVELVAEQAGQQEEPPARFLRPKRSSNPAEPGEAAATEKE